MASTALTKEDVERLVKDPSERTRAGTVEKIAKDYNRGTLSEGARRLAQEIFRLLLNDAAVRVREALSQSLKNSSMVPHDIAAALIKDVDTVAVPMLKYSDVLTDDDLIEIIASQNEERQTAIAGRKFVSEEVSDALVHTDNGKVVTKLMSNESALISERSLTHVLETLGDDDDVKQAMVRRPMLPITVVEKLMTVVAGHLKAELAKNQDIPDDLLTDIVMRTWERATIALSSSYGQDQLQRLIEHLHGNGRLKHSVVLRALCLGDIRFFETAVATMANLSIQNARLLIHDSDTAGLKKVCSKAGLPESALPAVRAAVTICNETELDGEDMDVERYKCRVVERLLSQYGDRDLELESGDLEYLFAKLSALPKEHRSFS
ncbi:MAG: DUF2336 domain-containing protein [Rhodospirillales bacterium]